MLRAVRVSLPFPDCCPLTTVHSVHHWLYIYAGILHRDLSPNNIMCRFIKEKNVEGKKEQKVYGVLTDYDLSSSSDTMNSDYTKTSQQRTGTPPYMAQELLKGTSPLHLYRHDLESLFYIMLLMAARHTIGTPEGEKKPRVVMRGLRGLPYQNWFDEPRYDVLGLRKRAFLTDIEPIVLAPVFEDFRPWLVDLQNCFSVGLRLKLVCSDTMKNTKNPIVRAAVNSSIAAFDDETLGGCVTYTTVMALVPDLTGQLEGLVIRDPEYPSVPAGSPLTGTTQADN